MPGRACAAAAELSEIIPHCTLVSLAPLRRGLSLLGNHLFARPIQKMRQLAMHQ